MGVLSETRVDEQEAIRLIDLRQDQVLEDLEDLNRRVLEMIEQFSADRSQQPAAGDPPQTNPLEPDQLEPAA